MPKKKRWKVVFQCVLCLKQKPFKEWSGRILNLKPKYREKTRTIGNLVCTTCGVILERAIKTGKVKSKRFAERMFLLGLAKPKPRKT